MRTVAQPADSHIDATRSSAAGDCGWAHAQWAHAGLRPSATQRGNRLQEAHLSRPQNVCARTDQYNLDHKLFLIKSLALDMGC